MRLLCCLAATLALLAFAADAQAQVGRYRFPDSKRSHGQTAGKPNILVIYGDDIGITNISAYSDGLMGYKTPNIDRIAKEGFGSCNITASSPAPRAARPSSPVSTSFAPASPKSVSPARRWA